MDERLRALTRARGGVVTVVEAARLGVTPAHLHRLRMSGALVHVRRGAYALGETWAQESESGRYALRVRAVVRTRAQVAASHHSALTLLGVPAWGAPADRVDVVDTSGRCARVRGKGALVVHPGPPRGAVVVDDFGDQRVSVETALLQVARGTSLLSFAISLDGALRAGLTSARAVRCELRALGAGVRWTRQVEDLISAADPLSPCVSATRLRILVADLGFQPRLRVPLAVTGGDGVMRPELVLGSSIAVVRTAYSQADRERLRGVGVAVAHVHDSDLDDPERVAAAIAAAMRELDTLRVRRSRGA